MTTSLPALLLWCVAAQDPSAGFVPAPWPAAVDEPAAMPTSLEPLFAGIESGPTPAQWRAVPVQDRAYLSVMVMDPQRPVPQRTTALDGLRLLEPAAASSLGQQLVRDSAQPDAMRVHAVRVLDGLLTGEPLVELLRPVLQDATAPSLRAAAAQTLAQSGSRHGCRLAQQQRARDSTHAGLWRNVPTRCR